ncbi:ABC transporter permease [Cryptosporangium arvum]|uniref:Putative exporter of polyketide antibiotics n=1 Tax=Cryptosporangium arvum DSM 44712 TaxID=927661 RepID=A0A011AID1_9ACTN|nr:ABC transporter permease [Cryptosporangium arvum]EXG81741.1 putative exporter of polyketide antibiotics [Cryptosporangium arvum DSM 44712]
MFAGTATLVRLGLRLDRVRLPIWVLVLAVMPAATAAQYQGLYPTDADIRDVSGILANPALEAINGALFSVTLGGLTAWKIGATEFVLVALMSLLTVVRHTRAEEETGRLELVGSAATGRYAPLTAALLVAAIADVAAGVLVAALLAATGLPVAGSVAFGLATTVTGLLFAGVAAVAAQLVGAGRSATGIAAGVLGAAYLARALGDTGPTWLSWASPIGWAMRTRAFADERWWVPVLTLAVTSGLVVLAYALVERRDVGASLVPERPAPGSGSLGSPFALAWRLQRGVLLGWIVAMVFAGAVLGGSADGLSDSLESNANITDVLARLGGDAGIVDAYLAAVFGIMGLTIAAYTVQATLRMRTEEASQRVEPLLATPVGRLRWALGHLAFAVLGTPLLLAVAGLAGGVTYGLETADVSGQVPRLLAAALVQTPAAWVLAGFGVALFGLVPRWSVLAWGGLIACVLALELGALLGLSQWLIDVSPFAHVPKLPGDSLRTAPLVGLTVVAAALAAAGLAGFRRRDVG